MTVCPPALPLRSLVSPRLPTSPGFLRWYAPVAHLVARLMTPFQSQGHLPSMSPRLYHLVMVRTCCLHFHLPRLAPPPVISTVRSWRERPSMRLIQRVLKAGSVYALNRKDAFNNGVHLTTRVYDSSVKWHMAFYHHNLPA